MMPHPFADPLVPFYIKLNPIVSIDRDRNRKSMKIRVGCMNIYIYTGCSIIMLPRYTFVNY
jgi:hypothetical protein